jgi:hypothetical protein
MAKKKRQRAGVWLATVSAVVGVATGMFTLRDQVFPSEAGSAAAVSVPVYRQQVGGICDRVNEDDRDRAKQDVQVRRRLARATTTTAQRNALLDGVRRTSARSGQTLAAFNGFQPPKGLAAARRDTQAAWDRNLARLRDYAQRLDVVTTRAQLLAAVRHLSGMRPGIAKDGVALRSGLQRLGGAQCDLQAPRVTATFTLPALPRGTSAGGPAVDTPDAHTSTTKRPGRGRGASLNTPDASASPGPSTNTPGASTNTPGASTNTPGASANTPGASANTPGASTNTPGAGAAAPSPNVSTPDGGETSGDSHEGNGASEDGG